MVEPSGRGPFLVNDFFPASPQWIAVSSIEPEEIARHASWSVDPLTGEAVRVRAACPFCSVPLLDPWNKNPRRTLTGWNVSVGNLGTAPGRGPGLPAMGGKCP